MFREEKDKVKKCKYVVIGKDKRYLSTLYKDSISDTTSIDNAMKFDSEVESKLMIQLAGKVSNNYKEARVLVIETSTYFLEDEVIPDIDL